MSLTSRATIKDVLDFLRFREAPGTYIGVIKDMEAELRAVQPTISALQEEVLVLTKARNELRDELAPLRAYDRTQREVLGGLRILVDELTQERDELRGIVAPREAQELICALTIKLDEMREELAAMRPVVTAAELWRGPSARSREDLVRLLGENGADNYLSWGDTDRDTDQQRKALSDAVDVYRKTK